jgi:hypothetical protein
MRTNIPHRPVHAKSIYASRRPGAARALPRERDTELCSTSCPLPTTCGAKDEADTCYLIAHSPAAAQARARYAGSAR